MRPSPSSAIETEHSGRSLLARLWARPRKFLRATIHTISICILHQGSHGEDSSYLKHRGAVPGSHLAGRHISAKDVSILSSVSIL